MLLLDVAETIAAHSACPGKPDEVRDAILSGERISQDADGALRNAVISLCQTQRPRLSSSEINEVLEQVFVDGGKRPTM
jgi:hypothetical protein